MDKTRHPPLDRIDWLLLAAIAGLSGLLMVELAEPIVAAWRNRPRPGVQVCQQCFVDLNQRNAEAGDSPRADDGSEASQANATTRIDYLLYLPREYAKDKKWPLIVFLHGAGERGDDLEIVRRVGLPKQVEQGDASGAAEMVVGNFVIVSPQCPRDSSWIAGLVLGPIEHVCRTIAVDRDRVYLTGHSMGGFGTWEIGRQEPGRFAAIAPLCGGGTVGQAERLKNVPVWAFHGAEDRVVPLSESRSMVETVRECGGQTEFTVYPDEGHGILDITYGNPRLYEWLLAQRRRQPQAAGKSDSPAP